MTKLQMIKFIEILKCNVNGSGKIVKWKESNK